MSSNTVCPSPPPITTSCASTTLAEWYPRPAGIAPVHSNSSHVIVTRFSRCVSLSVALLLPPPNTYSLPS